MAKLISFNVKGLNSNTKRRLLLTDLKAHGAEIVFLQETHFLKEGNFNFAKGLYPTVYSASQDRKRAGVAILISHLCPIQVTNSILDPNGRYVILQTVYQGIPLILCNVYVPNVAQIGFLNTLFTKLSKLPPSALIVGGDFNLVFSTIQDKLLLPGKILSPSMRQLSRAFRKVIRRYSLYDLWRIAHPTERTFSYYSPPHSSHSRIDYFFGNLLALRRFIDADIGHITWSDHAPVMLTVDFGAVATRVCHWRLNESLLKKPQLREELRQGISRYFLENEGSVSSPLTLWEAHKAVLRGQCIAIGSRLKRDIKAQVDTLMTTLHTLESTLAVRPSRHLLRKIIATRTKLKTLALGRVEKLLLYSRQRFYERANKSHTILARMLREDTVRRTPHSLRSESGAVLHDPAEVAKIFHQFFSKLYSLPDTLPRDHGDRHRLLQDFLTSCDLPTLSDEALKSLNNPVSTDEVEAVLKNLPSGKAPGPDGLTYLYYQSFPDLLIPRLTGLYNYFLAGEPMSENMLHSYITLIPKPGKSPLESSNYRPIALLNTDLKIFTKILADRLSLWLPQLVHKDQVGFVLNRQGGDNTRRAIDLIDVLNKRDESALLLSLDAEKAFDRLNWSFMFATLHKFGFEGPFIHALKNLYSVPSAVIRLPHAMSPLISIRNGTRQGCPLSPLLFVLCIEPLAAAIRLNPDIRGIRVRDREFKISLYADDVLLTLTNLPITLPNLHAQLQIYSTLSGYKINSSKTEALPINCSASELTSLQANFNYHWQQTSLKYLGVYLTTAYTSLYSHNFPKLFLEIRNLLNRWNSLPISFFGRISAIKMTVLPKLLYLFDTLPIPIRRGDLRSMQATLLNFIWAQKRHRISKLVLQTPKNRGGLAVPDLIRYYWAAQLRCIPAWSSLFAYSRWMEIEKLWVAPTHPNSFLWATSNIRMSSPLLGPMVLTREVWRTCADKFGLSSASSAMTSFLFNPQFPDSLGGLSMKPWFDKKLFRFADIVDCKTRRLLSFESLQDTFSLPRNSYYSYLQISHFMKTALAADSVSLPTKFEMLCRQGVSTKGLISNIYKMLIDPPSDDPIRHSYMTKWESYLDMQLPYDTWQLIWRRAAKSSTCMSYKENQYKILMLWYHTPALLHSLFPTSPDNCWRCGETGGTLFHIYWDCPEIRSYWTTVQSVVQQVIGIDIPLTPLAYILNATSCQLGRLSSRLLLHILTAAKCLIAAFWKKKQ